LWAGPPVKENDTNPEVRANMQEVARTGAHALGKLKTSLRKRKQRGKGRAVSKCQNPRLKSSGFLDSQRARGLMVKK